MRLTRETLLRLARETALKRSLSDPGLVAVYLTGSLLTESPFLGGAADIDLVCVHAGQPGVGREIQPVTPEVHLDLIHRRRGEYEKPKELRLHPFLGPELYDAQPLFNSQHFFEFVQAGVRDRYQDPASVLARCRALWDRSRQAWSELQAVEETGPEALLSYLEAVRLAAESLVLLTGAPLPERRLLLAFPARAEAAGASGLAAGLLGLLGGPQAERGTLQSWLADWELDFTAAAGRPNFDPRLAPARLRYYRGAFEAMLESETPEAILYPLVLTWSLAAAGLPASRRSGWLAACQGLGLVGPAFDERLAGLDAFLDAIDERLEAVAISQGLETGHI